MSRRELARRAATSASTLAAYEAGLSVPSTATLTRVLRAAGFDALVTLRPLEAIDERRRAAEIEALLELGDALPRVARGPLAFPVFQRRKPTEL